MHMYMYMHAYTYMYVCIYMYTHTHTHTQERERVLKGHKRSRRVYTHVAPCSLHKSDLLKGKSDLLKRPKGQKDLLRDKVTC